MITKASSQPQPLILNCSFIDSVDYTCQLALIEVVDKNQEIIFMGDHLEGRTNNDVEAVQVLFSNTPFMMQEIFTTFPNIHNLEWVASNLESIEIPDTVNLEMLTITRNNIKRINRGMLNKQRKLIFITLIENQIEEIDKDAFVGLEEIRILNLAKNRLRKIAHETFHPLANLIYVDFEANLLSRIDDEFSRNTNLTVIHLEFNEISKVSPRFLSSSSNILNHVDLRGNKCVDRAFDVKDEIGKILFNNALRTCFINFNDEEVSETKQFTLEFRGKMSLFDEFGNIIGRIN